MQPTVRKARRAPGATALKTLPSKTSAGERMRIVSPKSVVVRVAHRKVIPEWANGDAAYLRAKLFVQGDQSICIFTADERANTADVV